MLISLNDWLSLLIFPLLAEQSKKSILLNPSTRKAYIQVTHACNASSLISDADFPEKDSVEGRYGKKVRVKKLMSLGSMLL